MPIRRRLSKRRYAHGITQEEAELMADAYERDYSVRDIGEALNRSTSVVAYTLKRMGVAMRYQGGRPALKIERRLEGIVWVNRAECIKYREERKHGSGI